MLPTSFFAASKKDIVATFVIDRFEDGDIRYNPEWFTFGNIAANVVPAVEENPVGLNQRNKNSWWTELLDKTGFRHREAASNSVSVLKVDPVNGRYVLKLEGLGKDWFVGGVGTYLGIKADNFSSFYLRIRGYGRNSGRLQIELFDDDNGNFKLEQNPKDHYEPLFDDKFIYVVDVNWDGWKDILIPLKKFKDANPSVGDNILNLDQNDSSGGLLQVQLVGLTPPGLRVGRFSIEVDSVELR